eukprot:GHVO01042459.1.p1 GENE.GHVO01042459.1~~GHVO01042459.1.p1  ORF type:complete len:245 (-),score=5.71 GHVO01042459.1:103-810(-)
MAAPKPMKLDDMLSSSLDDIMKQHKQGRGRGGFRGTRGRGRKNPNPSFGLEFSDQGRSGRPWRGRKISRGAGGRPMPAIDTRAPLHTNKSPRGGRRGRGYQVRITEGSRLIQKDPQSGPRRRAMGMGMGVTRGFWNAKQHLLQNTALSRRQKGVGMGFNSNPQRAPMGANNSWLHRIKILAEMQKIKASHQASKMVSVPLPAELRQADKKAQMPIYVPHGRRSPMKSNLSDRFEN